LKAPDPGGTAKGGFSGSHKTQGVVGVAYGFYLLILLS
jgi:hypothetical protein